MTPPENAAESLVRAYLDGRTMPRVLQDAVVWVVASRLTGGEEPVLDQALRGDIDNQAIAPPVGIEAAAAQPAPCALLRRWNPAPLSARAGSSETQSPPHRLPRAPSQGWPWHGGHVRGSG
ncbi:hypothetical protein WDL1CHR_03467 [Variovorax sp. WDL1]|nr:hypothetical protein CHC07_00638 [Variovorax sp. B4]PNG61297.1 hypothetical protein CHC06_01198 [Variovorax sp. B2]VTV12714.1 hypothetical protein WDL1CHR_03467 [Variovorax sp. WDL1]